MRHDLVDRDNAIAVEYGWRGRRKWESISVTAAGPAQPVAVGSHEDFITAGHWTYTAFPSRVAEYRIDHPRWRIWPASTWTLDRDVFGPDFADALASEPTSAFIADGSHVRVLARA